MSASLQKCSLKIVISQHPYFDPAHGNYFSRSLEVWDSAAVEEVAEIVGCFYMDFAVEDFHEDSCSQWQKVTSVLLHCTPVCDQRRNSWKRLCLHG